MLGVPVLVWACGVGPRPLIFPMKPRILITNDDGIHSPGLEALVRVLAKHGRVTVAAPEVSVSP